MKPALWIGKLGACSRGADFVAVHANISSAYLNCQRADWLLWFVTRIGAPQKIVRELLLSGFPEGPEQAACREAASRYEYGPLRALGDTLYPIWPAEILARAWLVTPELASRCASYVGMDVDPARVRAAIPVPWMLQLWCDTLELVRDERYQALSEAAIIH